MITEDYVSFETAKMLKEKGFPQSTFRCHYIIDGNVHYKSFENRCGFGDYDIIAPTLAVAMKWLREVHNICITIYPDKENGYEAVLYNIKDDVEIILQSFGIYGSHIFEDSYEEAVEAGIKYCLENLI